MFSIPGLSAIGRDAADDTPREHERLPERGVVRRAGSREPAV
ncbi:MAG: hypothetical protein WDO68_19630 [Gammaproteobacteria bacterium]